MAKPSQCHRHTQTPPCAPACRPLSLLRSSSSSRRPRQQQRTSAAPCCSRSCSHLPGNDVSHCGVQPCLFQRACNCQPLLQAWPRSSAMHSTWGCMCALAVARIGLVKPEKARAIEDMILAAARKGQLKEKVQICTYSRGEGFGGGLTWHEHVTCRMGCCRDA
jgi:hypothetical protein